MPSACSRAPGRRMPGTSRTSGATASIGTIVTVRDQELSDDGVPRFPSYVGERIDVALPEAPAKPAKPAKASKREP
jgi:hypothetical protein